MHEKLPSFECVVHFSCKGASSCVCIYLNLICALRFNTDVAAVDQRRIFFLQPLEMLCAIWYHLYKSKNVKNTHGGILLLLIWRNITFTTSLKITLQLLWGRGWR